MKGDSRWKEGYQVTELLCDLVSIVSTLASKCPLQSPTFVLHICFRITTPPAISRRFVGNGFNMWSKKRLKRSIPLEEMQAHSYQKIQETMAAHLKIFASEAQPRLPACTNGKWLRCAYTPQQVCPESFEAHACAHAHTNKCTQTTLCAGVCEIGNLQSVLHPNKYHVNILCVH